MSQTLNRFIEAKRLELHQTHSFVELQSIMSVTLRDMYIGETFRAKNTPLSKKGREVKANEFPNVPAFSKENGTLVKFLATPKGQRKPVEIEFYFLWAD